MASLLKKQRLSRGLTQTELAKRVGTSQAQIYRLENSERKLTVEWAERLACALSTSAEALLFGTTPIRVSKAPATGRIPDSAQSIIAECLAFIGAMERQSNRVLSRDEQSAYLIKLYNTYLTTGQLPDKVDVSLTAQVGTVIYTQDFASRQGARNQSRDQRSATSVE